MASPSAIHDMLEFFAELSALANKYKNILQERENMEGGDLDKSDVKKRKRVIKDPNAPKRPMSAYLCFSMDARARLKNEHPELKNPEEVMQAIGTMWEKIGDPEKQKYLDRSQRLKDEYNARKLEYDRNQHAGMDKHDDEDDQDDQEDDDDVDHDKLKKKNKLQR